jgi:signal peptidase II
LIFAGALGNIIDSLFYGMLFSDSTHGVATFLPENGGYAPIFYGQVVDMLYFPLFEGTWPTWFPLVGGEQFMFFNAVFNVADSAITVGVILLILFSKKAFPED